MAKPALFVLFVAIASCDATSPSSPPEDGATAKLGPAPEAPEPEAAKPDSEAPAPEPEAPEPEAPEPERVSGGHADLDPTNDDVVGPPEPLGDCEEQLEGAGVRFESARIGVGKQRDGVYTCGAHQVVRFERGPGKIQYSRSPLLTCTMALALADFERIAQEEAQRHLGTRISSIDHMGTYNCREMVNYDLLSEHSFANGIDLKQFNFKNGESANVLDDFRPEIEAPEDPKTLFLRSLSKRLYDEEVFSVVVTPYFDHLHRNHIHVDLARYRVDGSRP